MVLAAPTMRVRAHGPFPFFSLVLKSETSKWK